MREDAEKDSERRENSFGGHEQDMGRNDGECRMHWMSQQVGLPKFLQPDLHCCIVTGGRRWYDVVVGGGGGRKWWEEEV